jgi:hypothetical protein
MLLAYTAIVGPRTTMVSWVQAAEGHGGHLAASTDLSRSARELINCGLAKQGAWIEISPQLNALVMHGQTTVLREVAQLLFVVTPPMWLSLAVSETGVAREYIPRDDLKALSWLEPDLDRMLRLAYEQLPSSEITSYAKEIGDAGELFVLAALRYAGARATHVAQFSDAFGYDIEVSEPSRLRIEVKAAGPKTAGQFYLTRNEFGACKQFQHEWRLLQVVFKSAAFIAPEIDCTHIAGIYELDPDSIISVVPPDSEHFIWQESAKIRPVSTSWHDAGLTLDLAFKVQGFAAPLPDSPTESLRTLAGQSLCPGQRCPLERAHARLAQAVRFSATLA